MQRRTKKQLLLYIMETQYTEKDNTIKIFPKVDQYEKQVTNFSNHILKKTPIDYDLKDAQNNIKIIESLFKSIKTKKWVKI